MEINGGVLNAAGQQANGSPIFPGSVFTGPLIAGNILHGDGSTALAGVGETQLGQSNAGYAQMTQSVVINSVATLFTTSIVLPAQSQITDMYLMVTTVQAAGTVTVGTTAGGATALTTVPASVATLGQINNALLPTTSGNIGLWDNTGNVDIQFTATFNATGAFVGTLTVFYVQGINNAS